MPGILTASIYKSSPPASVYARPLVRPTRLSFPASVDKNFLTPAKSSILSFEITIDLISEVIILRSDLRIAFASSRSKFLTPASRVYDLISSNTASSVMVTSSFLIPWSFSNLGIKWSWAISSFSISV